jgi:hypothetical protein
VNRNPVAGASVVPGLDADLTGDAAVCEVEHGRAQHAGAVRVTAGLKVCGGVVLDDETVDVMGHVAGADVFQEPSTSDTCTMYTSGYPDYPMPQELHTDHDGGTVAISCLVPDLKFEWRLRSLGLGTEITVHVEIPAAEAHRLATQQDIIRRSLATLAELAAVS